MSLHSESSRWWYGVATPIVVLAAYLIVVLVSIVFAVAAGLLEVIPGVNMPEFVLDTATSAVVSHVFVAVLVYLFMILPSFLLAVLCLVFDGRSLRRTDVGWQPSVFRYVGIGVVAFVAPFGLLFFVDRVLPAGLLANAVLAVYALLEIGVSVGIPVVYLRQRSRHTGIPRWRAFARRVTLFGLGVSVLWLGFSTL